MNWGLCCLCQSDTTQEALQTPKEEGLISLERDLNDFNAINPNTLPSNINVSISQQLNDGLGIAATLKSHNAQYHKTCRRYCSSSRVKRAREVITKIPARTMYLVPTNSDHLEIFTLRPIASIV